MNNNLFYSEHNDIFFNKKACFQVKENRQYFCKNTKTNLFELE